MKVDVISVDDWSATYVDGKMFDQSHSARADFLVDIMKLAGIDADYRWVDVPIGKEDDLEFPDAYDDLADFLRRDGE